MPTSIFAQESETEEIITPSTEAIQASSVEATTEAKPQEQLQKELDELTYEIISLRTENEKHFQLSDGTFYATVYSGSVHRLNDEGEWEEIDNSLSSNNGIIETKDSRLTFAEKITGNENIYTLKNGSYKMTVGLMGAQKKTEGVITSETVSEDGMTKLDRLQNIENLSSSIIYNNILKGVDIEYIIVSNDIKENIIVNERSDDYIYTFTLELNGLDATLENGDIIISDRTSGEAIYCIPAPFMYDSDGMTSYEAYYSLTELNAGKYEFTLTADSEWMNSSDRAFPVVIDPTVVDLGQAEDTYVTHTSPTTNFGGEHSILLQASREAYYKFATPNIPTNAEITLARLVVPYCYDVTVDTYVAASVYQVTSDWSEKTVTWNTKPTINSTSLGTQNMTYAGVAPSTVKTVSYTVTNYAKSWYTGTPNYGFALKKTGGTGTSVRLITREQLTTFAQFGIYYTGTSLAEGIYSIQKNGENCYFESYIPSSLGVIYQDTSFTMPQTITDSTLDCLFKISYRPEHDDYVIRSMLDSSVIVFPNVGNMSPLTMRTEMNDSELSTDYTWKIQYNNGYYYITHTKNGTKYYVRSESSGDGARIKLTTDRTLSGTEWTFPKHTGNLYEDMEVANFSSTIYVGDTMPIDVYMRSTRIGHNGSVSYWLSSTDPSQSYIDEAEIDQATGYVNALKPGSVKLHATYIGAPWVWVWSISVNGYASADQAALAFATKIYASSAYIRHEYTTEIYKITENGQTSYCYTKPQSGFPHSGSINIYRVPEYGIVVAYSHTHPNSNHFSTTDINTANSLNIDAYVNGPNLEVIKYDCNSGIYPISVGNITPTPLTNSEKTALQTAFHDSWYNHMVDGVCPNGFGCETKIWPNT